MQQRWNASKYREKKAKRLAHSCQECDDQLHNSRIINLDKLQEYVGELTTHATECGSEIILSGEDMYGMV